MLDKLYEIAEKENINIFRVKLDEPEALYMTDGVNSVITIDSKIKDDLNLERILKHELSHHSVGVFPTNIYSHEYCTRLCHSKNEFRAEKWLINKLMPYNVLKSLIKPDTFKYEVAEELEVTEDFIEKAYNLYRDKLKGDFYV
ncbi:MAG: hypothetical protein RR290_03730 [Clostridia bacterium]